MRSYWSTVYNHGKKLDSIIELEQIDDTRWRVVLDDYPESVLETTRQPGDFWGLVQEALILIKPNE
jgi:hypothetical protein